MPTPFPHRYRVQLVSSDGRAVLRGGGRRPDLPGGAPPEFDGSDEWWSPEHLLLSAASLCLKTTFDAFARRARLEVAGFESQAEGVLDKTPAGLAFTSIRISVELEVAEADAGRARQLLQTAERNCIVSNALRTPVELAVSVKTAPALTAPATT
jgi:organic hydroperoxide reductase OsmC/OhrA